MPTVKELKQELKRRGCKGYSGLRKRRLEALLAKCIREGGYKTVKDLKAEAKKLGCVGYSTMNRAELLKIIATQQCRKTRAKRGQGRRGPRAAPKPRDGYKSLDLLDKLIQQGYNVPIQYNRCIDAFCPEGSTKWERKPCFIKASRKYHPDKNPTKVRQATEVFKWLNNCKKYN